VPTVQGAYFLITKTVRAVQVHKNAIWSSVHCTKYRPIEDMTTIFGLFKDFSTVVIGDVISAPG
jgi:hypothetical protein